MNPSDVVTKLQDTWKSNRITFVNLLITFGTFGLEQISSNSVFRCPCLEQAAQSTVQGNRGYGLMFLFGPALVLFIICFARNPSAWKLFTGFCKRKNKKFGWFGCCLTVGAFMQSLVAPTAWISIALLEGQYFACAFTEKPYDQPCGDVYEDGPGGEKFSVKYHENIAISQMYGWIVASVSFFVGAAVFTWCRCCSPLVHWQRKYLMWTKQIERKQFEEVAKEQIVKETREHIKKFISEGRRKKDWEMVTEFHQITGMCFEQEISAYSALQKWCERFDKNNDRTPATTSVNVSALNDSSVDYGPSPSNADDIKMQPL